MTVTAWKVLTHDLRPPIQGGDPLFAGSLPFTLPARTVDTSADDCAAGWNAAREPATALQIAGLWPGGRPSRLFEVTTDAEVVERGNKLRASTWTIHREATSEEVAAAVLAMSAPFGDLAVQITAEQMAWRNALSRPRQDAAAVEAGLRQAVEHRSLDWKLQRYDSARAVRDTWAARDAWDVWNARAVRDTWDAWAVRDARTARTARTAWDAWAVRTAWDAWAVRDAWDAWAVRDAWAARAVRDAWDALTVWYAAQRKWVSVSPDLLTAGLRDAYTAGLGVAVPVASRTLGWAMMETE